MTAGSALLAVTVLAGCNAQRAGDDTPASVASIEAALDEAEDTAASVEAELAEDTP